MSCEDKFKCEKCKKVLKKQVTVPCHIISKDGGLADHKESEHRKKVKDPERAVKMRKKMFGKESVGDPAMKSDPKHIIRRGRTLGGQQKEVDRQEFIKAVARDKTAVAYVKSEMEKKGRK